MPFVILLYDCVFDFCDSSYCTFIDCRHVASRHYPAILPSLV